MATYSKCDIFYVVFSIIGMLAGLSGCITFLFVYRNLQASIWAFISGMYAATYLFLMCLKIRDSIDDWYGTSHLLRLGIFGGIGFLASTVAFITYFGSAVYYHEGWVPSKDEIEHSHLIMAVWAFLTVKWSFCLMWFTKSLSDMLRGGYISI